MKINEEAVNAYSHLLAVPLGIIAMILLYLKGKELGDPWYMASTMIYSVSVMLMYICSGIYHLVDNEKAKPILRKFDHSAIYLLIAGTYTPFTLYTLREVSFYGWLLFGLVWAIAILGIIMNLRPLKTVSLLKTLGYICMGLLILLVLRPLIETLQASDKILVLWWLVAGGAFYIGGTYFYMQKKKKYAHAMWHLFVLAGTFSHFMAVYNITHG